MMSATKIINVLKDDSFSEILELFKSAPAGEVIFVLPKRSRAFQKEDSFVALRAEAKDLGKSVSFLCSSPELNEMAKKYHFGVLLARSPVPRKTAGPKTNSISVVNQIEDFYSEPAHNKETVSIAPAGEVQESEDDPDFESKPVEEFTPISAEPESDGRLDDISVADNIDPHDGPDEEAIEAVAPTEPHIEHPELLDAPFQRTNLSEIKGIWGSEPTVPNVRSAALLRSHKIGGWLGNKPGHHKGLIAMALMAVIILGTVIFISTGKAQVTIKPVGHDLDLSLSVVASDNILSVDPVKLLLPGQVFNIQKTVSKDFPATGHVDVAQKARGAITIYNELSSAQPLVATTRFESADNHIFHTLTSVIVPPAKTSNGKLVPGTLDVQVIADKPGADFNIAAGKFTVPAFKEMRDTAKFSGVYGQSTVQMHSGTSGQSNVATEADLNAAKKELTGTLSENIQEDLKSQIGELKIVNDSQINVGPATSDMPSDVKSETFTASLSGSIKTVGFKESDLNSMIVEYVDAKNKETVLPEKLTLVYDNIHWDDARGGLVFTVHVTGQSYAKVDQAEIAEKLLGKDDSQIKAYLGGIAGISEAHVSLSPFWVRSIPSNPQKVKVDLSY